MVAETNRTDGKMMEMLEPLTKEQMIKQMGIAYGKFAEENNDMAFSFPVLILLGNSDKTGKVRQYCEMWARDTAYPLHIIENAAHFSNGNSAEQVNREVERFMQGL